MNALKLSAKAGRARALKGHPWVYQSELEQPPPPELDGESAELRDAKGRLIGAGVCNSRSQIVWRRYSRGREPFDEAWLREKINEAADRRSGEPYCRLVWSEADFLPGLVADRYDDVIVLQALTLAADRRIDVIAKIVQERFDPREIVIRNDAPTREREGLELHSKTWSGKPLEPFHAAIDGLEWKLDLMGMHKTGFYLDQRAQRRRVAALAEGRRALDGFSSQGGFALHCAAAGAASVEAVEISDACLALAKENAERNGLTVEFHSANMFDWLTASKGREFDLIILDPPSFAKNAKAAPGALRGYKELCLRSIRMLSPGGILAVYCCSQRIGREAFEKAVFDAAADARRDGRMLERTGQPADHPELLGFPESAYLKGLIIQVL